MSSATLADIADSIRGRVWIIRETPDQLEWLAAGMWFGITRAADGWRVRGKRHGCEVGLMMAHDPAAALDVARELHRRKSNRDVVPDASNRT